LAAGRHGYNLRFILLAKFNFFMVKIYTEPCLALTSSKIEKTGGNRFITGQNPKTGQFLPTKAKGPRLTPPPKYLSGKKGYFFLI
jgi:Uncharacterized protein conserved in bacteria